MIEAYKKFWKGYVDFEGHSTVSDYWWVALWHTIVIFGFLIVMIVFGGVAAASENTSGLGFILLFYIIMLLYGLAVLIPNLALMVRRIRDAGHPWVYIFFGLIPFAGSIILLVFSLQASKDTDSVNNNDNDPILLG